MPASSSDTGRWIVEEWDGGYKQGQADLAEEVRAILDDDSVPMHAQVYRIIQHLKGRGL